eukprot:scaffold12360_cov109-Isochrysis_galbana.AAC.11
MPAYSRLCCEPFVRVRGDVRSRIRAAAFNPHRPPVERLAMPRVQDHLRRQIIRRAAEGEGALSGCQPLGEAEVDELDVALGVEQQVLGLEVAEDDTVGVQVR